MPDQPAAPAAPSHQGVVSAANLLLVAIMKLNRALVPVLLRWIRGRRINWIRRSSRDVYLDLRDNPKDRFLCFGECCAHTYQPSFHHSTSHHNYIDSSFHFADDSEDSDDDTEDAFHKLESSSIPRKSKTDLNQQTESTESFKSQQDSSEDQSSESVALLRKEKPPQDDTPIEKKEFDFVPPFAIPFVKRSIGRKRQQKEIDTVSVEEQYFRLLVAQEEIHRSERVSPFLYQTVLYALVTVMSLILYSVIIIMVVSNYFPMTNEQFVNFSFSLITTATVSEADKLLQVIKKRGLLNFDASRQGNAREVITNTKK